MIAKSTSTIRVSEKFQPLIAQAWRVAAEAVSPGAPPALAIYLFEVKALTAELRKALVAAFRNKAANVLLILTTRDYDPLDFVLVEKEIAIGGPAGVRTSVSHRLLSVDRRHPSRVHLRVLQRMSRSEAADAYGQFERIRDAFRLAEWSEDEFNNRGLFSDYFLKSRLPDARAFPAWSADLRQLRETFLDHHRRIRANRARAAELDRPADRPHRVPPVRPDPGRTTTNPLPRRPRPPLAPPPRAKAQRLGQ